MGSLKEIRRRISSVTQTRQITRAMKLVAAAKLRRAQERIEAQRPYAHELRAMIASLAAHTDRAAHPLLRERPLKNVHLLVLTSDRGLCGGFNTNICRATESYVKEHLEDHENMGLVLVGKKGRDYFRRRDYTITAEHMDVLVDPEFDSVARVGDETIGAYVDRDLDGLFMVYNEFKSAGRQEVVVEQLLPIVPEETEDDLCQVDFIYEPSRQAILDEILPLHVKVQIWRAVLESLASEMGARMTAMDGATRNAEDLIERLTLQFNRARQEAITNELMEIIGGAEALKG